MLGEVPGDRRVCVRRATEGGDECQGLQVLAAVEIGVVVQADFMSYSRT